MCSKRRTAADPLYYISEDQWQIEIHIQQITHITVEETGKKCLRHKIWYYFLHPLKIWIINTHKEDAKNRLKNLKCLYLKKLLFFWEQ